MTCFMEKDGKKQKEAGKAQIKKAIPTYLRRYRTLQHNTVHWSESYSDKNYNEIHGWLRAEASLRFCGQLVSALLRRLLIAITLTFN